MIREAFKSGSWDVSRVVATVYVKAQVDPIFDRLHGLAWDYAPDFISLVLSGFFVVFLGNKLLLLPRVTYVWSDEDRLPVPSSTVGITNRQGSRIFEVMVTWETRSALGWIVGRSLRPAAPTAEVRLGNKALDMIHHKSVATADVQVRQVARGVDFALDLEDDRPATWSDCQVVVIKAANSLAVPVKYRLVAQGWLRNAMAHLVLKAPNVTKFQLNRVN